MDVYLDAAKQSPSVEEERDDEAIPKCFRCNMTPQRLHLSNGPTQQGESCVTTSLTHHRAANEALRGYFPLMFPLSSFCLHSSFCACCHATILGSTQARMSLLLAACTRFFRHKLPRLPRHLLARDHFPSWSKGTARRQNDDRGDVGGGDDDACVRRRGGGGSTCAALAGTRVVAVHAHICLGLSHTLDLGFHPRSLTGPSAANLGPRPLLC